MSSCKKIVKILVSLNLFKKSNITYTIFFQKFLSENVVIGSTIFSPLFLSQPNSPTIQNPSYFSLSIFLLPQITPTKHMLILSGVYNRNVKGSMLEIQIFLQIFYYKLLIWWVVIGKWKIMLIMGLD